MNACTRSDALTGRVILVSRGEEPARPDSIAAALREAGATVIPVALTRTVPGDTAALARGARALADGCYRWLVLTSARTVEALLAAAPRTGLFEVAHRAGTRIATVGEATARAVFRVGGPVDLIGAGSARSLAADPALAGGPGAGPGPGEDAGNGDMRCARNLLLPCSRLAPRTLEDALSAAGWQVDRVEAYGRVPVAPTTLPGGLAQQWRTGGIDVLVVTSGSAARAALSLWGSASPTLRVVTLGESSAEVATRAGLSVSAVAEVVTPAGICEAVRRACGEGTLPPTRSSPLEPVGLDLGRPATGSRNPVVDPRRNNPHDQ